MTVSVSQATNTIGNTVEAAIRNAVNGVTSISGDISVEAESGGTIQAIASAASVSVGGAGIANVQVSGGGAAALNIITTSTRAAIEKASDQSALNRVTSGAGLRVGAKSSQDIDAAVAALSAAGGGAGIASVPVAIGLSGAQNIIGKWTTTDDKGDRLDQPTLKPNGGAKVEAVIADTVADAAGTVAVTATSAGSIDATVAAASFVATGALVGVGVAGSGSYSGNAISFATHAAITEASTSVTGADVSVLAANRSAITVDIGAAAVAAAGGVVGVAPSIGVATALNVINNAVTAQIDKAAVKTRTASTGTGTIRVAAQVPADDPGTAGFDGASIRARVAAAAVALSGGGVAVSVAGGGAVATNMIGGTTRASVTNARLTAVGDVAIAAENNSRIEAEVAALAAGASIGGVAVGASIGTGVAVNLIGGTIDQTVDGKTKTTSSADLVIEALSQDTTIDAKGNLSVTSVSGQTIRATVAAGSVAISGGAVALSAAGAGAGAHNRIGAQVSATIEGAGGKITAGDVTVAASDASTLSVETGAASVAASFGVFGSASFSLAVSAASNAIANIVTASISNLGSAGGLTARGRSTSPRPSARA